jgi:hypothetical protein
MTKEKLTSTQEVDYTKELEVKLKLMQQENQALNEKI